MTTEEAIQKIEQVIDTVWKWMGTEDFVDALDIAVDALRAQQERENPKPLTPEVLREMDDPVWCVCDPTIRANGFWLLCEKGCIVTPTGISFRAEEIPDWVFLRHKPKEAE